VAHDEASLVPIDDLMGLWSSRQREFTEYQAQMRTERAAFIRDASEIMRRIVHPALEDFVERLTRDGGGGHLEERPCDTHHAFRLTLWMSLDGEVGTPAHQDGNPYLQLDVDVANRQIKVWEGDMWQKQGCSRAVDPWRLDRITAQTVTDQAIAILRRAASHDIVA
jgi:hypothetical protein